MLLGDFMQSWLDGRAPERIDLAPGDRGPQPYVPNPAPQPGIIGNLTDWGRMADAFTANNNLISAAADWVALTTTLAGMKDDPGFNVFRDYDFGGMERYAYQFGWARSREQADEVRRRLIEDAASRARFSELDPLTQFVVGAVASTGPADFVPLGLGRAIASTVLLSGGAIGAQAIARQSMALQPGDWRDAAMDAAMGALFSGGYRAAMRLLSPEHGPNLDALRRTGDAPLPPGGERPSAGPFRAPEPAPIARTDFDAPPFATRGGDTTVRPGPDGAIEMPRGEGYAAPRIIAEDGTEIPGSADFTDRRPTPSSQPITLDRPVVTDGSRIYELRPADPAAEPTPIVTGADPMERPRVLAPRDGATVMVDAPSPSEILQGRLSAEPFETRTVRLTEAPEPPIAAAAEEIPSGRPIVIVEDGSVGAAAAGNLWTDTDSRLARAGGLERIRLTPAAANLASANAEVRESMAALASHNMVLEGNLRGLASEQSVEARHAAMNNPRIVETVHGWWSDYAAYAQELGGGRLATGASRTLDFVGTRVANAMGGPTYRDFMREVSAAIVDGGQHASAAVASAARRFGAIAEDFRRQATEVGYWDFLYQMRVDELKARRAAAQDPVAKARIDAAITDTIAEQARTQAAGGPVPQHDRGYLPRYYRYDKIMAERPQVEAIFDARIRALDIRDPVTGAPYTGREAVDILLNIDPATNAPRPYVKPKGDQWAHSGKERGIDWMPTKLLWDYIETDAEVLMRRYVRQMGVDIELTRRFGDPFMMREIQRLAGSGASPREIENLMFVRDVIKGTHAPMDPTSIVTHSVQAAKMMANMVVLGAQTITAFTDLARPLMTEGIQRAFGTTFDLMSDGFHGLKLQRREAELLGSTGEMVLALRQQAFANGSSAFAGTPTWLQGIERAHSLFFMLNGIAPWTEVMKTWQSVITTTRVMEDTRALAAGTLDEGAARRLAQIGIDEKIAGDIVAQLDRHEVHLGRTSLPNVGAWDSGEALTRFRTAIWQATNRSIVTPGAADTPRWAVEGTSWLPAGVAQVISMYHNYGVALHHRLVVAGLQGADAQFLAGAMALVGLGYMVDHLRDQLNAVPREVRDRRTGELRESRVRTKSVEERLLAAVDRAGLLGYATNVNNAIERLSFNTIGVKPFTGQVRWGEGSIVGALGGLGPVGSWAGNLYRTVNGEAHDRRGWAEAQAMRRLLPLNNLFYLDGLFDRVQLDWHDPKRAARLAQEQRRRYAALATDDGGSGAASTD